MMGLKNIINVSTLLLSAICLNACDDGHIDESNNDTPTEGFTVQLIGGVGTLKSLSSYSVKTGNSVAITCFNDESEYALMQRNIPKTLNTNSADTLLLSNVPANGKTLEIAVVNTLRKRILTLYSYELPSQVNPKDTVRIDMGSLFDVVSRQLFQKADCSRCHSEGGGAANLDLSKANAYASLVGIHAYKKPSAIRVKPFDAENSYLFKVLSEGDANVSYAHPSLMADYQGALQVLKLWINEGAKR